MTWRCDVTRVSLAVEGKSEGRKERKKERKKGKEKRKERGWGIMGDVWMCGCVDVIPNILSMPPTAVAVAVAVAVVTLRLHVCLWIT